MGKNINLLTFSILLIILSAIDYLTTLYALSMGMYEASPTMKHFTGNSILFLFVKSFVILWIIGCYKWILSKNIKMAKVSSCLVLGITLFAVLNNIFVISASAESGNLNIDATTAKNNYYFTVADGVNIKISGDYLFFDKTDYNRFFGFQIRSSDNFAITNDKISTWFIVSGGSGTGTVRTNISQQYISWTCDSLSGCEITDSNVSFSYADPGWKTAITSFVFNNTIAIPAVGERSTENTSTTKPICLPAKYSDGVPRCWQRTNAGTYSGSDASVGVRTLVAYNVTYVGIGGVQWFNTSFGKPSSPNTQVFVNTSTGLLYQSALNNVNVSSINPYGSGIILRANTATATSGNVTVNSSGCSSCIAPTPVPTPRQPNIDPNTGGGIAWDKTSYTRGDIATIRFNLASSIIDFLYNFNIRVTNLQSGSETRFDNLPSNILPGNVQYNMNVVSNYKAELYKSLCVLGCIDTLLATDYSTVFFNESYIFTPKTVPVGVPFNATYIFGNAVYSQGELNSFQLSKFTEGVGYSVYNASYLGNSNIQPGVSYNVSITIGEPGTYKIELIEYGSGVVAFTTFDVFGSYIPPQTNIAVSHISTDAAAYFLHDTMLASYAIDNVNYSNATLSKYIQVVYTPTGEIVNIWGFYNSIGVTSQQDTLMLLIGYGQHCPYNPPFRCFESGSGTNYQAGDNDIQLRARTNNSDVLLAHQNFTVRVTDDTGYGLSLSKTNLCLGEPLKIDAYSPTNGTVLIWSNNDKGGYDLLETYKFLGNKTINLVFSKVGQYKAELYDSTNNIYQSVPFRVDALCNVVATPTPSEPTQQGQNAITRIDGMVNWLGLGVNDVSKFLFALIFITVFGAIGIKIAGGTAAMILSFASYIFFTYIEYVPKWVFIIVILMMAVYSRVFR